jgi:diadenosine tetraphosphate (Ap4A) HIT family hydrolase
MAIQRATSSIGTFNWFQNGLRVQYVGHFHFHILPRFEQDDFLQTIQNPRKMDTKDRYEWAGKIRKNL